MDLVKAYWTQAFGGQTATPWTLTRPQRPAVRDASMRSGATRCTTDSSPSTSLLRAVRAGRAGASLPRPRPAAAPRRRR